jgi:hypothetical protein
LENAKKTAACRGCFGPSDRLSLLFRVLFLVQLAFLDVAVRFLNFAGRLLRRALDLLFPVLHQLTGLFLRFARDLLRGAFQLVFVHLGLLNEVGIAGGRFRQRS